MNNLHGRVGKFSFRIRDELRHRKGWSTGGKVSLVDFGLLVEVTEAGVIDHRLLRLELRNHVIGSARLVGVGCIIRRRIIRTEVVQGAGFGRLVVVARWLDGRRLGIDVFLDWACRLMGLFVQMKLNVLVFLDLLSLLVAFGFLFRFFLLRGFLLFMGEGEETALLLFLPDARVVGLPSAVLQLGGGLFDQGQKRSLFVTCFRSQKDVVNIGVGHKSIKEGVVCGAVVIAEDDQTHARRALRLHPVHDDVLGLLVSIDHVIVDHDDAVHRSLIVIQLLFDGPSDAVYGGEAPCQGLSEPFRMVCAGNDAYAILFVCHCFAFLFIRPVPNRFLSLNEDRS